MKVTREEVFNREDASIEDVRKELYEKIIPLLAPRFKEIWNDIKNRCQRNLLLTFL